MPTAETPAPPAPVAAALTATVRDARGRHLADCEVVPDWRTGELVVTEVLRGKGALLAHHFGAGRGIVTAEINGREFPGRLATAWAGSHRAWRLIPETDGLSLAG